MAEFPDFEREFEHLEAQLGRVNDEINRRSGRQLLPAIGVGLALGAIVVLSMFVKVVFAVFVIVFIALAAFELATALRDAGRRVPRVPLVVLAALIVAVSYWLGDWWQWLAFLGGAVLLVLWRLVELAVPRLAAGPRAALADVGAGVFVLGYVALLGSYAALVFARPDGHFWVLAMLIVVVVIDIAAYAVGRSLGRHPMAPRISPNKSWEGFAGAAAAALISGCLVVWLLLGQPWWLGLPFGAIFLVTGTAGDLAESIIKRDLGVKDMSSWLPGHGGILDRIDGVLLSTAPLYGLYLLVH